MEKIVHYVSQMYLGMGVSTPSLKVLTTATLLTADVLMMCLLYVALNNVLEPVINKITERTEVKWDDLVFRHKALRWVWLLFPLILGKLTVPASLYGYVTARAAANTMFDIALVLTLMMVVIEAVSSVFMLIGDHDKIDEIAEHMRQAELNGEEFVYTPSHSLKGLQQMLQIIVIALAAILCISILFGKNPLLVISGLGAAAAILMLVFQDSILGVVAGIQLTANDMLQPGDWIKSQKYEANGIVQEVTLAAVKVRNWDQTIVTIPPYKLLTDGFQNWKGMQMSKGRRITRSVLIDMTTIRYATDEEVAQWKLQPWWRGKSHTHPYPKKTRKESHEPAPPVDTSPMEQGVTAREQDAPALPERVVNLTALRMYLEYFVTKIPTTRHNMLYMIRELQPTPEGLPVEIYFFTSRIDWKGYEAVMADLTDQVIAMLGDFGLRVYQRPGSYDFKA